MDSNLTRHLPSVSNERGAVSCRTFPACGVVHEVIAAHDASLLHPVLSFSESDISDEETSPEVSS